MLVAEGAASWSGLWPDLAAQEERTCQPSCLALDGKAQSRAYVLADNPSGAGWDEDTFCGKLARGCVTVIYRTSASVVQI